MHSLAQPNTAMHSLAQPCTALNPLFHTLACDSLLWHVKYSLSNISLGIGNLND